MDIDVFLAQIAAGGPIRAGSPAHQFMHDAAQRALRITAELNSTYHEPDEVRALLGKLLGRPVPPSVTVFPPFYSEFGQNPRLGEAVFINMGCRFQDTGGITIGDESLMGTAAPSPPSTTRSTPLSAAT